MFTKKLRTDFYMKQKAEWMRYVIGHGGWKIPKISATEFKDMRSNIYVKMTDDGELTMEGDLFNEPLGFTYFDHLSETYESVMRTAAWMLDKGMQDPELSPIPARVIAGYYTRIPHTEVRDSMSEYVPKSSISSVVLLTDPETVFRTLARDGWVVKQKVSNYMESGQCRITFTRESPKDISVMFVDVKRHLVAYLADFPADALYAFISK